MTPLGVGACKKDFSIASIIVMGVTLTPFFWSNTRNLLFENLPSAFDLKKMSKDSER
jgi:hypothetical protein